MSTFLRLAILDTGPNALPQKMVYLGLSPVILNAGPDELPQKMVCLGLSPAILDAEPNELLQKMVHRTLDRTSFL